MYPAMTTTIVLLSTIFLPLVVRGSSSYIGKCPYCDPNYVDVPNLQSAMQGYHLAFGDPDRAGIADPGVRDQIFIPMKKNEQKLMEVDGDFITVNDMIRCDSEWDEEVHHDLDSYIRGKMRHSLIGMKSSIGKDLKIPYKPNIPGVTLVFTMPTLLSKGRSNDNELEKIKAFFEVERGSIAVSQASCSTHRVDLATKGSKRMTLPFIEALKGLHLVTNESESKKDFELSRFLNEFGTHFSQRTILGVKLYSERRYTKEEKKVSSEEDMKKCNTAIATKLIGMHVNPNVENCDQPSLLFPNFTSNELQRYVVTTFGSYAVGNGTEWSKQIKDMHEKGILFPVPIKRKLQPIVELFVDKSIQGMKLDDGSIFNGSSILNWMLPKMATRP